MSQITRRERAAIGLVAAVIVAAHYWVFSYMLGLETPLQRSLWIVASLIFLLIAGIAVALWTSAPVPGRTGWREALRSAIVILAGVGGLLRVGTYDNRMQAGIFLAFVAILACELLLRARRRGQRLPPLSGE